MKRSLLVVDDDEAILRTVKKIFETNGYNVQTAASGEAALEIMRQDFSGLVLMDIEMPGMDGWDTIEQIVREQLHEDVIICMLTGRESPGKKMEGLKEYVLDYIRKPFDAEKLLEVVDSYYSFLT